MGNRREHQAGADHEGIGCAIADGDRQETRPAQRVEREAATGDHRQQDQAGDGKPQCREIDDSQSGGDA